MLAVRRSPNLSFTQACVTFVTGRLLKTTHQHPSDCTADVGSMTAVMAELYCSLLMIGLHRWFLLALHCLEEWIFCNKIWLFFFQKLPSRSSWRRLLIGRYWPIPDLCVLSVSAYMLSDMRQYWKLYGLQNMMPNKMFGMIYNHHTLSESVSLHWCHPASITYHMRDHCKKK